MSSTKSRQKRWVPYEPRQLPLQDQFLDGIKSVQAPNLQNTDSSDLQPPQKVVRVEDLLTRITSVPQRQTQMFQSQSQRFHNNQMQFRPTRTQDALKSHMEQRITKPSQETKPYWLQLDYLASILQQNQEKFEFSNRPTIIINDSIQPSQVSTSCGPRGCTATSGTNLFSTH